MNRLLKLLILGPPGSGKGTLGKRVAEMFDLKHLASGDILRDHVTRRTPIGSEACNFIEQGRLVPDSTIEKLMISEIKGIANRGWILDGFPRTLPQAESLAKSEAIDSVLYLDVPFDTIIGRVKDRWLHCPSGRIYNLLYNPPKVPGKDDITGEPLIQREDDKPETVKERLNQYTILTKPLLDFYKHKGVLMTFKGTESDAIWPELKDFIQYELLT